MHSAGSGGGSPTELYMGSFRRCFSGVAVPQHSAVCLVRSRPHPTVSAASTWLRVEPLSHRGHLSPSVLDVTVWVLEPPVELRGHPADRTGTRGFLR